QSAGSISKAASYAEHMFASLAPLYHTCLFLTTFSVRACSPSKNIFRFFQPTKGKILSTRNTATQAQTATVRRLFSRYAAISATTKPAIPEKMLEVADKIAGNVMAARQAYGT